MKKRKYVYMASIGFLVGCSAGNNNNIELGSINVPTETTTVKETSKAVENKNVTIDVAQNGNQGNILNMANYKDKGILEVGEFDFFSGNENIQSFISTTKKLMYKKENNIYAYDYVNATHTEVKLSEAEFNPYKLGTENTYILSLGNNNDMYKVIHLGAETKEYKFTTDKNVVLANDTYAFLYKDNKFYLYKLSTNELKEVPVVLGGKSVALQGVYDRYDNKSLVFHTEDKMYLVRTVEVTEDKIELKEDFKFNATDIRQVLRNNQRNDNGYTVYISKDDKLKIY